jgi:nucleoid-associated protein YgaU
MGRLEKIVVLTVLFLVAVILAVSLNRDSTIAAPQESMLADASDAVVPGGALGTPPGGPVQTPAAQPPVAGGVPPGALSSSVDNPTPAQNAPATAPQSPGIAPAPQPTHESAVISPAPGAAAPAVPLVTSTAGLEPSLVPDLMLYTWQAGDTFTKVADRYFASRLEVGKLRAANEGRNEADIAVGEKIFVPVKGVESAARLGRDSSAAGQREGGFYVVKSGDILGKIAQETYGSAAKWRRIYEANQDVLSSPDALKVGMRLRIPAE